MMTLPTRGAPSIQSTPVLSVTPKIRAVTLLPVVITILHLVTSGRLCSRFTTRFYEKIPDAVGRSCGLRVRAQGSRDGKRKISLENFFAMLVSSPRASDPARLHLNR